jgi:hypothetical protein
MDDDTVEFDCNELLDQLGPAGLLVNREDHVLEGDCWYKPTVEHVAAT